MVDRAHGGQHVRAGFKYEDAGFRETPTDDWLKPFGRDTTIQTLEGSNNAIEAFGLADNQAEEIIAQHFEGSLSVQFNLSNPFWAPAVLEDPETSGTEAPYDHEMRDIEPTSLHVPVFYERSEDMRLIEGYIPTSASIDVQVDGTATVQLNGPYAYEDPDPAGYDPNDPFEQPVDEYRSMTFAQAQLEKPDGTMLDLVQNVSLTINANAGVLRGLGSRFATDYLARNVNVEVNFTKVVENREQQTDLYGAAAGPQEEMFSDEDLAVSFNNGLSGDDENALDFTIPGGMTDRYSESGIGNPQQNLEGQVNFRGTIVNADARNDVEDWTTAPA